MTVPLINPYHSPSPYIPGSLGGIFDLLASLVGGPATYGKRSECPVWILR